MTNAIAELRDLNLELESLKARKNAIKTKLAEHRDSFTDEDKKAAVDSGMNGFVSKPIVMEEIIQELKNVFE